MRMCRTVGVLAVFAATAGSAQAAFRDDVVDITPPLGTAAGGGAEGPLGSDAGTRSFQRPLALQPSPASSRRAARRASSRARGPSAVSTAPRPARSIHRPRPMPAPTGQIGSASSAALGARRCRWTSCWACKAASPVSTGSWTWAASTTICRTTSRSKAMRPSACAGSSSTALATTIRWISMSSRTSRRRF